MAAALFYALSLICIVSSLIMIFHKNTMYSVLFLLVTFFSVAGLYVTLNAQFLAIVHIIVYAGAIMVLFLYVMMLLNLEHPESPKGFRKYARYVWILMIPVFATLGIMLVKVPELNKYQPSEDFGSIASVGTLLLGNYVFAFEAVSFVLLAAMIGVVVLTSKKRDEK